MLGDSDGSVIGRSHSHAPQQIVKPHSLPCLQMHGGTAGTGGKLADQHRRPQGKFTASHRIQRNKHGHDLCQRCGRNLPHAVLFVQQTLAVRVEQHGGTGFQRKRHRPDGHGGKNYRRATHRGYADDDPLA